MRGEEMRCYYCLKDEYDLPLRYIGLNKDGKEVEIALHDSCWQRIQTEILDGICKGRFDFKETKEEEGKKDIEDKIWWAEHIMKLEEER